MKFEDSELDGKIKIETNNMTTSTPIPEVKQRKLVKNNATRSSTRLAEKIKNEVITIQV